MSVQVSYKNQFVLGIIFVLILLAAVELVANVWLSTFYRCSFEESEIAQQVDPEINRKMCLESLGYEISDRQLLKTNGTHMASIGIDENIVFINSKGLRGPEFEKEKPENTYRIFTIGGSTTFSTGVLDDQTYPFYLQQLYDEADLGFNVEVINAGLVGRWSFAEIKFINEQLLDFKPDLFIVLDGWNDSKQVVKNDSRASAESWKERWIEICDQGKQYGYDTIVTLQPLVATGNKILSEQEMKYAILINELGELESYPEFAKQLEEIKNHCSATADLRGIFDYISEPIYFDRGHVGSLGNKLIAKEMYKLSLPIVVAGSKNIVSNEGSEEFQNKLDERLRSNNINIFLDDSFNSLKYFISPYKTPKLIPLIFDQGL